MIDWELNWWKKRISFRICRETLDILIFYLAASSGNWRNCILKLVMHGDGDFCFIRSYLFIIMKIHHSCVYSVLFACIYCSCWTKKMIWVNILLIWVMDARLWRPACWLAWCWWRSCCSSLFICLDETLGWMLTWRVCRCAERSGISWQHLQLWGEKKQKKKTHKKWRRRILQRAWPERKDLRKDFTKWHERTGWVCDMLKSQLH